MFAEWINWLEHNLLQCPSVKYLNMQCPGCGMQRSFIALMKGDLLDSLQLYPALIPIFILVIFSFFHLIYRFSFGTKVIIGLQVIVVAIIVAHYFFKIFHHQIFL
ncbi:MAG: DUF2752 domain-containing protein [Terrimonas sp.]|nr:DUF2752 domain-containing protein [Terrimonas sp.]OJY87460.1 MAG: hypothetical protein BGP13_24505 [Sphingobacteriales bacterium 40-81]